MTIPEIAHSVATFAPFQSWAARYSGPDLVNRPDLGLWSMAPAGVPGEATLAAAGDGLVYTASPSVHGFLWRSGVVRPLQPGERVGSQPGDRYVLCTAGVLGALGEADLARLMAADEDAPAERLVLAALAARATGDVAAITVGIMAADSA